MSSCSSSVVTSPNVTISLAKTSCRLHHLVTEYEGGGNPKPFVKVTYNLDEGDGFLALETYERVNALYIATQSKHMPIVPALEKREASGNHVHEKQVIMQTHI